MIDEVINRLYNCLRLAAINEPERDFDKATAKLMKSAIEMMETKNATVNPYSNDPVEYEIAGFIDAHLFPGADEKRPFQKPSYLDAFLLMGQMKVINEVIPNYHKNCIDHLLGDIEAVITKEGNKILSFRAHPSLTTCFYYCYAHFYRNDITQTKNQALRDLWMDLYNRLTTGSREGYSQDITYGYLYTVACVLATVIEHAE